MSGGKRPGDDMEELMQRLSDEKGNPKRIHMEKYADNPEVHHMFSFGRAGLDAGSFSQPDGIISLQNRLIVKDAFKKLVVFDLSGSHIRDIAKDEIFRPFGLSGLSLEAMTNDEDHLYFLGKESSIEIGKPLYIVVADMDGLGKISPIKRIDLVEKGFMIGSDILHAHKGTVCHIDAHRDIFPGTNRMTLYSSDGKLIAERKFDPKINIDDFKITDENYVMLESKSGDDSTLRILSKDFSALREKKVGSSLYRMAIRDNIFISSIYDIIILEPKTLEKLARIEDKGKSKWTLAEYREKKSIFFGHISVLCFNENILYVLDSGNKRVSVFHTGPIDERLVEYKYGDAIKRYQENAELHVDINTILLKRGNEAIDHANKGIEYLKNNRYAEAEIELKTALSMFPGEASGTGLSHIYNALGTVYLSLERYDEAEKAYDNSISNDLANPGPHLGLGLVLLKKSDPTAAIKHFNRALERDPNNQIARDNLELAKKHMK